MNYDFKLKDIKIYLLYRILFAINYDFKLKDIKNAYYTESSLRRIMNQN